MNRTVAYSFSLLTSLLMLAGTGYSQSGWFQQNPWPQGMALFGVTFTDANTRTIVGDSGTILRATTGGATRTNQLSAPLRIAASS